MITIGKLINIFIFSHSYDFGCVVRAPDNCCVSKFQVSVFGIINYGHHAVH